MWAAATKKMGFSPSCNEVSGAIQNLQHNSTGFFFKAFMATPQSKPTVFNLVMNAYIEVKMIAEAAETFYIMKDHGKGD